MTYDGYNVFISGGYPAIYIDGEIVRIHILEMERHLNRKLKSGECVHHKDEDKMNYHIDNLLCFRSNADHVAFHNGTSVMLDNEGIAYCPTKGFRKANSKTLYTICPKCGNIMAASSHMCVDCYRTAISKNSKKPSKEELINLLDTVQNLTHIGNMFGVSANSVKKWLKSYDIHFSFRLDIPEKQVLLDELKTCCPSEIARNKGVSRDVVKAWMKKYDIFYIPSKIQCVETGEIYDSMSKVADAVYPKLSRKSVVNFLGKVIDTKKHYHGYHWIHTNKVVLSFDGES